MKKLLILYSEYTPVIDAIKYRLQDFAEVVCAESVPDDIKTFDLVALSDYRSEADFEALSIHYSLLPAFAGKEPVKEAVLAGVKVTGVTIFYTKSNKIVSQYPVFIYNDAHYDEIQEELKCIAQALYPQVIEKIIKNEAFETRALMSQGYGCYGGCTKCKK
jgi:phosphoribosylglycinamide formyltransferase-1